MIISYRTWKSGHTKGRMKVHTKRRIKVRTKERGELGYRMTSFCTSFCMCFGTFFCKFFGKSSFPTFKKNL